MIYVARLSFSWPWNCRRSAKCKGKVFEGSWSFVRSGLVLLRGRYLRLLPEVCLQTLGSIAICGTLPGERVKYGWVQGHSWDSTYLESAKSRRRYGMLDIALRRVVTFQKLEFSCSDANSVDIFSTRARCTKRYSNNGPPAAAMRRRRANIFGDLRIS